MASTLAQTTLTARASWLELSFAQQTLLKYLAIGLMLLDHANRSLWVFQPWAFALGRLAFPLFAFLIAYNLAVRKVDADRYVKLLLFGMISQLPAMLALEREILPLNIFFTLLVGVSVLPLRRCFSKHLPDGWPWPSLSWLAALYLTLLIGVGVEFGSFGVMLIPAMTLFLERPSILPGVITTVLLVGINGANLTAYAALLTIPVIYAVSTLNLPPLPRLKWFFYSFYPAHLALLWLIKLGLS